MTISCSPETKANLEQIAIDFGHKWGDKPNISALLESIAAGEIELSKASRRAVLKRKIVELKEEIKSLDC